MTKVESIWYFFYHSNVISYTPFIAPPPPIYKKVYILSDMFELYTYLYIFIHAAEALVNIYLLILTKLAPVTASDTQTQQCNLAGIVEPTERQIERQTERPESQRDKQRDRQRNR